MRLIFETEDLKALLDPSKRDPEEEKARREFLAEVREFGKALKIERSPKPAPSPAHD